MAFHFVEGESAADGIRRIAREQIDGAIEKVSDSHLAEAEKVHELRKHCKKLRAVLRLVRPSLDDLYAQQNAYFRDAAQSLAPLRDAQIVVDAYDRTATRYRVRGRFAPVRRRLVERRKRLREALKDLDHRFHHVAGLMEDAREYPARWPIDADGIAAWQPGFEQTYRKARRSMACAYQDPTPEQFHEWRKSEKYHWYHTRLLRPLWQAALGPRVDAGDELGEMLGAHHDLVVLRATLVAEVDELGGKRLVGALAELVDRHRVELEAGAKLLGQRLLAEKAKRIGQRYAAYWSVWLEEQRCRRAADDEPRAASV
jgi:CHAD domain-containing protein